jgi:diguanylate cyclase (GGDEF)-like protein/PAS domain S-box-containing protein
MFQWIRAFAQTTTYLGLAVIASIWCGVFFLTHEERARAYEEGVRQGSNLARVFEAYISRVIGGADSALLTLRDLYQLDPQHFDIARPFNRKQFQDYVVAQFGIVGRDGRHTISSARSILSDERLNDRDYFRFHANSRTDELYISAPVAGLVTGKQMFHLTRRLTAGDGSFGGVILATIDIPQLEKFYSSIDIGRQGVIALIGFDGIIRARSGRDPEAKSFVGQSNAKTQVFSLFRQSPAGSYWNFEKSEPQFEGVRRLISYQVVEGFPLVAVVGLSESDIFQQSTATARRYYLIALVVTAIVVATIGIGARRQRKLSSTVAALEQSKISLERSKLSLEQTNLWFDTALKNMAHGLCMFDRDQRLIVCNDRYAEMYGLTRDQTRPGTTLRSILEARVAIGASPKDAQTYIEQRLKEVSKHEPYNTENELHDGRIFAVNHQPMQDGGWVAVHQDITQQRLTEQRIEAAKQELIAQRYAFDQAVIVGITDVKGRITYANDNFCRISGYTREELLGENHRILDSGVHSKKFFRDMYRRIARGQIWRGEICNKAKDGSLYWVDTTIVPRLGQNGKPSAYLAIRIDITTQKQAEVQIAYMARHDALTGIANRVVLLEKIKEALTCVRRGSETFAIFMLDLDLFKGVNDSLGHPVGDELLKAVARRLLACVRETDTVVRLGGDEFAILAMAEKDQREAAIVAANRLLEAVDAPYDIDGHTLVVGASIGIALAPEHATDVDQLMKNADLALYKAKSEGRNTYRFFEDAMGTEALTRRALQVDLRAALANDELELHYQPIVDIKTREISSVEALVRWRHPQRGMIAPGDFIPLAEETGLINSIGEWVLRKACSDAVAWPSPIKLSVNLSPVQFRKISPVDIFCNALSESGLPPERLELEITESVLLQGNAENVETLHQLRLMGISIVLDDFGTGYSSLSYLRMFPFDKIKIDRSFVNELSKNADCASIVSAVAGLGRSLQIGTVAEGIETEDQLILARAAGCTLAQGFLFGRPCPASELKFRRFRPRRQKSRAA